MTEGSLVEISLTVFQNFDHGQTVEVLIPKNRHPKANDLFYWGCAQFEGLARVVCVARYDGESAVCRVSKVN